MKHRKNKSQKKHWCKSCDRAFVSDGSKCPHCGKKELPKSPPIRDLRKLQKEWEMKVYVVIRVDDTYNCSDQRPLAVFKEKEDTIKYKKEISDIEYFYNIKEFELQ